MSISASFRLLLSLSLFSVGMANVKADQVSVSMTFCTYLGGSTWEHARDVATDPAGNIYVVGGTGSSDFVGADLFPGANVYNAGQPNTAADGAFGGCDVFITKMNKQGKVLWTKLMGGKNYDRAYAVEVDKAGNVYVAGRAGIGFPTVNAFQSTFSGPGNASNYGNQNGFVVKLDPSGAVLWSSYAGIGTLVRDLAIDDVGDVYIPLVMDITSNRALFDTPALAAFQGKFKNSYPSTNTGDVGVAKLKGDGSGVIWARWIGGSGNESTNPSIRVDAKGQAHLLLVTASTSTSLPSVGKNVDTENGGSNDSFVAKLNASGTALIYGTYLGGAGDDGHETHSLALDPAGNAVVAIHTNSTDFPITPGTLNAKGSLTDVGVAKFDSAGKRILSTLIGGNGGENPDGIYIDGAGRIFLSVETTSTDFPTTASALFPQSRGGSEGSLVILSGDLKQLLYSSYIGGSLSDNSRTLFLSSSGSVYLAGGTLSPDLPVYKAYQANFKGGSHPFAPASGDCWAAGFSIKNLPIVSVTASDPTAQEGKSSGAFRISRTGVTSAALLVRYTLPAGNKRAQNGVDFRNLTGQVTIAKGKTSALVRVQPLRDKLKEGTESAVIAIHKNSAYTVGVLNQATVRISD